MNPTATLRNLRTFALVAIVAALAAPLGAQTSRPTSQPTSGAASSKTKAAPHTEAPPEVYDAPATSDGTAEEGSIQNMRPKLENYEPLENASVPTIRVVGASPARTMVESMEAAHAKPEYDSHGAVVAKMLLEFGGGKVFEGRMGYRTDFSGVEMDSTDGWSAIWDGSSAWVTPADAPFQRARFHVLTWPYFLAAPYKMSDLGVVLGEPYDATIDGNPRRALKVTFESGIGDAPDDWYILYLDPETSRLEEMGYIVTYGKGAPEPNDDTKASIIIYRDYETLDDVPVPTTWTFHYYDYETGELMDQKGRVRISDIWFGARSDVNTDVPNDAREDKLPE